MRYFDKTADFLATAKSSKGQLIDPHSLLTDRERKAAEWLREHGGGNIIAIPRAEVNFVSTPDLLWDGGSLEIKHTNASLNGLDMALRKAIKQTDKGGILVDITDATFSNDEAIEKTRYRLNRSGGRFAILIRDQMLVAYISK